MYALTNSVTGQRVELSSDTLLTIDGLPVRIDGCMGAILHRIIREAPELTTRSAVSAVIVGHHRSVDSVSKSISELRQRLTGLGVSTELVKTVHRQGYCLNETWCRSQTDHVVGEVFIALQAIKSLCEGVEKSLRGMKYETSASGAQFVIPREGAAASNFKEFDTVARGLLGELAGLQSANGSLISRLKNELFQLASYVSYWRVGIKYEESEWKDEFSAEMHSHLAIIETLVDFIQHGRRAQTTG